LPNGGNFRILIVWSFLHGLGLANAGWAPTTMDGKTLIHSNTNFC
jgi:hypothetical protein